MGSQPGSMRSTLTLPCLPPNTPGTSSTTPEKAFVALAMPALGSTCRAATIQPNDVQLTYLGGGAGVFGNGALYASQKYTFAPGDVVDFGMVTLFPDPWDGRQGPPPSTYTLLSYYNIYYLESGVGGLELIPFQFDVNRAMGFYPSIPVFCTRDVGCPSVILHLIANIPQDKNGVQIAFFGGNGLGSHPSPFPLRCRCSRQAWAS